MSGKWDDPSVPKTGWECIDVYDDGDDDDPEAELTFTCEMCETKLIRYVHVMTHPDYPGELGCGCICSGHMDGDGDRAVQRENRAKRRYRFPHHKNWTPSQKGNAYLRIEHHVLICCRLNDGKWKVVVRGPDGEIINGVKRYDSQYDAKLGAFDGLIYAQSRLNE